MIKLQSLMLALASVLAEVHKIYPVIPSRFLKMKGLTAIVFVFEDRIPLSVQCTDPSSINARLQCFNDLLKATDRLKDNGDQPVSITLMFNGNRGYLQDTYYL